MALRIETIQFEQLTQLLNLLREFAQFENLQNEFLVDEEKLNLVLFGEEKFVECLVGFADEEMVAYAIFFPIFRTFRGDRSMYLEDLYVKETMRGRGFGLAMLKAVARQARERGFSRMDWQALNWNIPAIDFYKKLGAESNEEQMDFRLIGAAFEKLAS
jgi:GNAT superfamily N-acetyltransferase